MPHEAPFIPSRTPINRAQKSNVSLGFGTRTSQVASRVPMLNTSYLMLASGS